VEIGRTEYQGDGRNYGFEGTIDNVRVYERELTDSEMADLYAAGTAGSFNTSVKSGRSLAPNDVELVWDGDVPSGTEVEVRLRSGSGSGFGSTTITSDSGTDASFSGASATDDYYLSVRLTSNSAGKSPTIDRLLLRQE
jgi:dUTPase